MRRKEIEIPKLKIPNSNNLINFSVRDCKLFQNKIPKLEIPNSNKLYY
jgi:hypothetical protein